ncbi:sphingomyelin synthase family protein [Candidatus Parcubacteria bacterium]|nr:sphingomyelin synthase family protein [Candidatus Parcubacteria bacterium]
MKPLVHRYKLHLFDKHFVMSLVISFLLLLGSLVVNFYAGTYATHAASNHVSDVILSNIPVIDFDWTFTYGPAILWAFVSILCLWHPKRAPFVLKSIALFILIRSVFITLTHIGPFPDQIAIDYTSHFIKKFTFQGDLFFSAHTGLPFLMALIFQRHKIVSILFIITSVFFGIIVLLAHLHYTIDVLSAFFITFTIYKMAQFFFKKDWLLFVSDHS